MVEHIFPAGVSANATGGEWAWAMILFLIAFYSLSKFGHIFFSRFQYTLDPHFDTARPVNRTSTWIAIHTVIVIMFDILSGLTILRLGNQELLIWLQFTIWAITSAMVAPKITQYGSAQPQFAASLNIVSIILPGIFVVLSIAFNFDRQLYFAFSASFHIPPIFGLIGIMFNAIRKSYNLPPPNFYMFNLVGPESLPPLKKGKTETWRTQDLHTTLFMKLVTRAVKKYKPEDCAFIRPPTLKVRLPLEKIPGFDDIFVSMFDENGTTRSLIEKFLVIFNHKIAPMNDDKGTWPSREEAMKVIDRDIKPYTGRLTVEWKDPTSDAALQRFCFQGLIAHRLEKVSSWETNSGQPIKEGQESKLSQEKVGYAVRLDFMSRYPVRDGLARYGGDVYFDSKGQIRRIHYCGVDVYPGDEHWEYTKYCFRNSALVLATIWDHVIALHFMTSNTNVLATRQAMHPDHPIRRFLTPFVYRTVVINESGIFTLAPHRGLFHRATSFTWPALLQFYHDGVSHYRIESFPEMLQRNGTADLPPELYIYRHDGLDYWNKIASYVHTYLKFYYPDWKIDDELRVWWQELVNCTAKGKMSDQLDSLSQIERYLTFFIFSVTSRHEQVGGVTEYILDPAFAVSKWAPGSLLCSSQTTYQMGIVAMLTSLRMPQLTGDWTHVLLDTRAREIARAWIKELKEFSAEIDRRNSKRAQPLQVFNPSYLETSVSI